MAGFNMRCIDEEAANIILKLIGHDGNILSVCDDAKEVSKFVYELFSFKEISPKYEFYIWDIIGLHANDILTKEERDHIDYLDAQGTDSLVDEAKRHLDDND